MLASFYDEYLNRLYLNPNNAMTYLNKGDLWLSFTSDSKPDRLLPAIVICAPISFCICCRLISCHLKASGELRHCAMTMTLHTWPEWPGGLQQRRLRDIASSGLVNCRRQFIIFLSPFPAILHLSWARGKHKFAIIVVVGNDNCNLCCLSRQEQRGQSGLPSLLVYPSWTSCSASGSC